MHQVMQRVMHLASHHGDRHGHRHVVPRRFHQVSHRLSHRLNQGTTRADLRLSFDAAVSLAAGSPYLPRFRLKWRLQNLGGRSVAGRAWVVIGWRA
jgi:hypothetical protein